MVSYERDLLHALIFVWTYVWTKKTSAEKALRYSPSKQWKNETGTNLFRITDYH
ncbi:hypothetical protein DERF_001674 [Dermatophagoides farinae]|uniref:Uncharacterized protein n=1 Tax=Dermatophagoides farinae TaxID=6954 RepID=A0A922LBD4_DERFA|nr:hypothetical protein DERF_001674 [Dermatophagoides farinae]